jgi:hypothetical protein
LDNVDLLKEQWMTELSEERRPPKLKGWSIVLRVLRALDLVVFGGLVALLIVNRLLVAQVEVYNPDYMAAASAIINFLDDIAPYLAGAILSFLVLTFATVTSWLWAHSRSRLPRYGIALLVLIVVVIVAWTFVGRGSGGVSVPMMTPTPVP